MWNFPLYILTAAIPAVIVLLILQLFLRIHPQEKGLAVSFFLGFIAVLPAAVIEIIISGALPVIPIAIRSLFRAFFIAALVEEVTRYYIMHMYLKGSPLVIGRTHVMAYFTAAGLGFAFYENIIYGFGSFSILLLRGVTAVPLHALCSAILGYFVGRHIFGEKGSYLVTGIGIAIFIHGMYNYLLFNGYPWAVFVVLLIAGAGWASIRMYKHALFLDGK